MPPPSQPSVVFATDESLLIRAGADYAQLCPESQKLAFGTDGVLDAAAWSLTSASVDFEAAGVATNNVIRFDRPTSVFRGAGEWFAVESAAGNVLTLRRYGLESGVGQPPPSIPNVQFTVLTMLPQLQEASFKLYQRFSLDDSLAYRSPNEVYDLQVLRDPTVLTVLEARYLVEARDKSSDFWPKYGEIKRELADCLELTRIRWGTASVETQPSTSIFGMRYSR